MLEDPTAKYPKPGTVDLRDRRWPSRSIERPPVWASVDLRDGNQALVEPMDAERKGRFFDLLVELGFKEIEIGFPSASRTEFEFCRRLIEEDRIPDDVTVQVLVQARAHLVERTFQALAGIDRAIVHVYNSTSTLQRRVVFKKDRNGIREMAIHGARMLAANAARYPRTRWMFEYSPESFTGTELEFAAEVCDAVLEVWKPTPADKAIVNLPATVEMTTPNVYADRIEWMDRQFRDRDSVVLSIHPHNDRGTAVAAAELALLAGADRVEGTLFGNGERTGNVDILTLALNMYSHGIAPGLDFSDLDAVRACVEFCNRLEIHPRHPYAGDLVFTAFSGSHQDAIRKGLAQASGEVWAVPYLPIDPGDIGRSYAPIVRVNSQSGKSGVAFLLERDYGVRLPPKLQAEFGRIVQDAADTDGGELTSSELWALFGNAYLDPAELVDQYAYQVGPDAALGTLTARLGLCDPPRSVSGQGHDPIEAMTEAVSAECGMPVTLADSHSYSIDRPGQDPQSVCIVEMQVGGMDVFGVGIDVDPVLAALTSVAGAFKRALESGAPRAASSPAGESVAFLGSSDAGPVISPHDSAHID